MNLIDEYMKTVEPHLDAPRVFIEASAYHLVSVLLGQFCASASAPGTAGLRPNAWIMISSIPARGRRSTVANYSNLVYEHASRKFYEETLSMGHDEALRRTRDTYIEEGTKEGIIDHIDASDYRTYYINSTEFGAVLRNMVTKDHEMDLSALYSKLYYGEGGVYHLSKKSSETPSDSVRVLRDGKYVTMFCGLQEPHLYITPSMMRQGLIRRILLIYAGRDDFGKWIEPFSDARAGLKDRLRYLGNQFYNRMSKYNSYSHTRRDPNKLLDRTFDFDFHPRVSKYINNYSKELNAELLDNISNVTIYKQTLWEHLAKYSMLHAIARDNVKIIDLGHKREVLGRVDPEDVQSAHKFIKEATKHSEEILGDIGRIDAPIRTSTDPLDRVYGLIRSSRRISRSDLYRKTKMLSHVLDEILRTLMEQDRIEIEIVDTGGRKKAYYVKKE